MGIRGTNMASGLRQQLAPGKKALDTNFRRLINNLDFSHSKEVRDLMQQIVGCMDLQSRVLDHPQIRKGMTNPNDQARYKQEHIMFAGVKTIGDGTAEIIRRLLMKISPTQRLQLYSKLVVKGVGDVLQVLDRAMMQGDALSQEELAEAVRLRFLQWLPPHIQKVIDPLMKEWTYEQYGGRPCIKFPPSYSREAALAAAKIASRQRMTSDDFLGMAFFLSTFGADPSALLTIQGVIEELEIEKETLVVPAAVPSQSVAGTAASLVPAEPAAPSATEKKPERPKMSEVMQECATESDRLLGFQDAMPHATKEVCRQAESVVGDTSLPAYARARDALELQWQPANGHVRQIVKMKAQAARILHGELSSLQVLVPSLYKKTGTDHVETSSQNFLRIFCTVERRMRREFLGYLEQNEQTCGPMEENVYASLLDGLAAFVITWLDDSFLREKSDVEKKDHLLRKESRAKAKEVFERHLTSLREQSAPGAETLVAFLTLMNDYAAHTNVLIDPSQEMDDRKMPKNPEPPQGYIDPKVVPPFMMSRVVSTGKFQMRQSIRYDPDVEQAVHMEIDDGQTPLRLGMEAPGSAVCFPGSAIPLHSALFPKSSAIKEANGHREVAHTGMQQSVRILQDSGVIAMSDALRQSNIRPHVVSYVDLDKGDVRSMCVWSFNDALALNINAVPLDPAFGGILRTAGVALPSEPWMTPYVPQVSGEKAQTVSSSKKILDVRAFFSALDISVFPLKKVEALLSIAGITLMESRPHGKAIDSLGRSRAVGNRVFKEHQMPKDFLMDILLRTQRMHIDPIGNIDALHEWIQSGGRYENL